MRVLNLVQFFAQPEGIIFTCGKQWAFNDLMVKGETIIVDGRAVGYWSRDLCWVDGHGMSNDEFDDFNRLDEMIGEGASYPLNDNWVKDIGLDADLVFLVYEDDDLASLAQIANNAVGKLRLIDERDKDNLLHALREYRFDGDPKSGDHWVPDGLRERLEQRFGVSLKGKTKQELRELVADLPVRLEY